MDGCPGDSRGLVRMGGGGGALRSAPGLGEVKLRCAVLVFDGCDEFVRYLGRARIFSSVESNVEERVDVGWYETGISP